MEEFRDGPRGAPDASKTRANREIAIGAEGYRFILRPGALPGAPIEGGQRTCLSAFFVHDS